jgi:4-carboxymuconolactone decarboxylase
VNESGRPRISPVRDLSAEQHELLAKSTHFDGAPLNAAATLAHHPLLLKRFMLFAAIFLTHSRLPDRDRELITLRATVRCQTRYYFAHHIGPALVAGLTRDQIAGMTSEDYKWQGHDRLMITATDEIVSSMTVSDDTWNRLAGVYNDAQLEEILFLPGFYRMLAGFVKTIGVEIEPGLASALDLTETSEWPCGGE